MDPLFNSRSKLVGWIENDSIYDARLRRVAFVSAGHAWSTTGPRWLGPIDGMNIFDTHSRPVAFNPRQPLRPVSMTARPATPAMVPTSPAEPARPEDPVPPAQPVPPAGGWSPLDWNRWLTQ